MNLKYSHVYGYDIVSFYAFINNKEFKQSVTEIYDYLELNEFENSFSSDNQKSYWEFEEKPLRDIDYVGAIPEMLDFFRATKIIDYKFNSSSYDCLRKYTLCLSHTLQLTVTFTLWKNKSGDLRWFAKEPPVKNLPQPSLHVEASPLKLLIKAGEPIPGADIERKMILAPWIESGFEVWLYGPEKSHKSRFARTLAQVMAYGGKFLDKYETSPNLSVLYIDCEFLPDKFYEYCNKELNGLGYTKGIKFNLIQAKSPHNPSGQISLFDEECIEVINTAIAENDIVFLDCFYKLADSNISPKKLLEFIAPWKNKGKSFVIVDHDNSDGDLQGSKDKIRNADLCIKITKINNNNIELSFPTARYLSLKDASPLRLKINFEKDKTYFSLCESVKVQVEVSDDVKRYMLAQILVDVHRLKPEGDLDKMFGYSKSTIYGWLKKFSAANLQQNEKELFEKYQNMSLHDLNNEVSKLKNKK